MTVSSGEVTNLLRRVQSGDSAACDQLYGVVEHHLRAIARKYMGRERPDHTLQTTLLIDDAFLQLAGGQAKVEWQDRSHFYRTAARAMRRILVDYERRRQTEKRGGGLERSVIEPNELGSLQFSVDLIALDEALEQLCQIDERQSQIVELHHFGGCTFAETAEIMGTSQTTVKREWTMAKAWLHRQLSGDND